ncbi:MAG TPA: DHH family phosphoesterase [Tepidisphaeraceae bacterium]|nr:DHH family phosphoesterase [Tepidisphaeraceae bacterium]
MADQYRRILSALSASQRVLVTTHVRPDGDALGTAAAMVLAMRRKKIDSRVLLLSHLPSKYAFVFEENQIPYTDVEKGWPADFSLDSFDTLLVVDTGTWSQLPGLKDRLATWNRPKLVVDHHLTQEEWATEKLVITEAAAAGEIAAELIEQWEVALDRQIATVLFVAIASDTGWFQFSNTRPFTHRLAASLMEAGVDTDRVYQLVYQNERPSRVALQTRAMQSMELLADNRLAILSLGKEAFAETGAGVGDTENVINVPLQIRTIEAVALLVDPPDGGPIRISLRSKGRVDVAHFAEQFGGGGHARAAGMKVATSLESAREAVIKSMLEELKAGDST